MKRENSAGHSRTWAEYVRTNSQIRWGSALSVKRVYKGHLLIPAHRQVGAVLWQLVSPGLWGTVEGIKASTDTVCAQKT